MNFRRIIKGCFFIIIILMCHTNAKSQNNGRISGTVVDKTTQKPINSVSVTLDGSNKGGITDSNGVFRITGLDLKTYNIEFTISGYTKKILFNIVITSGNEKNINVELDPKVSALPEVVVSINKRTARAATLETPLSVQRLTAEEIESNPGGNFDISKVIQTPFRE